MNNTEIIEKYLKEKNNEDEVITLLKEQKKMKDEFSPVQNNEYFSLITKLIKESSGKVKHSAISLVSSIELCFNPKKFEELCQIVAENSINLNGNVRQACFLLAKNLSTAMIVMPLINKVKNSSETEINLVYESYKNLFYKLHNSYYDVKDENTKASVLRMLRIMLTKFQDMAEFWNDFEDINTAKQIQDEINKNPYYGNWD